MFWKLCEVGRALLLCQSFTHVDNPQIDLFLFNGHSIPRAS